MAQVVLNVYDVTPQGSENTHSTITTINGITHTLGLGGVFHGAIEVYGQEWSFGYSDSGSGIYKCPPRMHWENTFRESVALGVTNKSEREVMAILKQLGIEWPGSSYDLISRNCCHFCSEFAARLGTDPVPSWLNRFAEGAESAIDFTDKVLNIVSGIRNLIGGSSQASGSVQGDVAGGNIGSTSTAPARGHNS